MRRWLWDFFEYHPWVPVASFVALLVALVMLVAHSDETQCEKMMSLARSSRDSLDATIACNQLKASTAQNIAIGAAAGAVAGSMSSSR